MIKKWIYIGAIALGIFFSPTIAYGALTDGLIEYWKLDGDSNGEISLNGTDTNVSYVTAKINDGASLAGTGFIAQSSLALPSTDFSVSFWVNINTAPSDQRYTFMVWTSDVIDVRTRIDYLDVSGTKTLIFNRSKPGVADQEVSYGVDLGTATWHYITMTYDGTDEVGYLNGVEVATMPTSGNGTGVTTLMNLGQNHDGNAKSNAIFDEVGWWNRALDPTEITSLYNGGAGLAYPLTVPDPEPPDGGSSATSSFAWFLDTHTNTLGWLGGSLLFLGTLFVLFRFVRSLFLWYTRL